MENNENLNTVTETVENNTQDTVDTGAIAKKERERGINKVLKELGVESIEQAKELKERFNELNEQQLTAQEKMEKQNQELQEQIQKMQNQNKELSLQTELLSYGVSEDVLEDAKVFAKAFEEPEIRKEKIQQYFNVQPAQTETAPITTGVKAKAQPEPKKESIFSFNNMLKKGA